MSLDAAFSEAIERAVERGVERALRKLQPELLTPEEAGALAKKSAKTIREWIRLGKLRRHGQGRPMVSREELLALLVAPRETRSARNAKAPTAEGETRRLLKGVR